MLKLIFCYTVANTPNNLVHTMPSKESTQTLTDKARIQENKTKTLSIRLKPHLRILLEQWGKEERRPLTNLTTWILTDALLAKYGIEDPDELIDLAISASTK